MSLPRSILHVLTHVFDFKGRAGRSEYWWWIFFCALVNFVAVIIDTALGADYLIYDLTLVVLALLSISVSVRRMHDTGRSGWFVLLWLLPVLGLFINIALAAQDSSPDNKYGVNAKRANQPTLYDIR